jgi:hypothetical protein
MKRLHSISILLMFLFAGSSWARAADISSSTVQGQILDWSDLQSVGGIQIEKTLQEKQSAWAMTLLCDLSGKQTFTQKPTKIDSGWIIKKTLVTQEGRDIFISLVTSQTTWTMNPDRCLCHSVVIESTPGFHSVFYRDGQGRTFPIGRAEFNMDSAVLNSNPG